MSDAEAIRRVLAGDVNRFSVIYDRYSNRLFGLFFGMFHDKQVADELRVDTLSRAYEKLGTWQGRGRFWSWLWRLAMGRGRDRIRYRGRNCRPVSFEVLGPGEEPSSAGPGSEHEEQVRNERLYRALAELSGHQRAALLMRAQGMRLEEISGATGRCVGTVGSDLHRGLAKLRKLYGQG